MSKGNLSDFIHSLHPSTKVVSTGTASVLGNEVPGVLTRNVYGQEIVWGFFGCNRGKFKGTLSNSAATENVEYTPRSFHLQVEKPTIERIGVLTSCTPGLLPLYLSQEREFNVAENG